MNWPVIKKVGEISVYSLINIGEIFPVHFLFLIGLFIGKNQLIVNIIYLNFFFLVSDIYRWFYYTIKKELSIKYQDWIQKQNYLLFFSVYYSILSLTIFILLILFKNILLNIYIQRRRTYIKGNIWNFENNLPFMYFMHERKNFIEWNY